MWWSEQLRGRTDEVDRLCTVDEGDQKRCPIYGTKSTASDCADMFILGFQSSVHQAQLLNFGVNDVKTTAYPYPMQLRQQLSPSCMHV
jgi:hypothetical protein